MRITARLILSLVVAVASVAALFTYWQVLQEKTRQEEELDRRARLTAESLEEAVDPILTAGPSRRLDRLVERFDRHGRVEGIAIYDSQAQPVAVSSTLETALATPLAPPPEILRRSRDENAALGGLESVDGRQMHLFSLPVGPPEARTGHILLLQDATYIDARLALIWRNNFLRVLAQMVLISLVTVFVVRWSVEGPVARMAEWMKHLRSGSTVESFRLPEEDLFAPIAREASTFARHLTQARSAAEEEARLRRTAEALWTPERLKEFVRNRLQGKPLIVVSNREPYMHTRKGRKTECIVPAGGLVAALDPTLRATDGLWIAHGSGDADTETSDAKGHLRVPPDDPHYTLRRVWLTKEEEAGYYYGFANEGLWPLCHIAHARPLFRAEDWAQYEVVNRKFAETVLEEIEEMEEPCLLIQDYHFALLARFIKEKRPDARIALFWHIPWPNPEAFSICPWQKEILYGMLGADIVGFHTQFHCNNFLQTVDRTLECRIDAERLAVEKGGRTTLVRRYPISVEFPTDPTPAGPDRETLLKELDLETEFLAVGVDRVDYTKGILERFRAVERFLEMYPAYVGRFSLVQIGAPSRTHIPRYHDFLAEVEREAERISWKYRAKRWRPIVLLARHHGADEIRPYYRAADLCLVTSLHDGMNLVAKEFVASREDENGVLVLSRFAGASRELRDAVIVNPYDTEQVAEAIRFALEMDPEERTERMRQMREAVRENNVFRWAGSLISDLADIPLRSEPQVRA